MFDVVNAMKKYSSTYQTWARLQSMITITITITRVRFKVITITITITRVLKKVITIMITITIIVSAMITITIAITITIIITGVRFQIIMIITMMK